MQIIACALIGYLLGALNPAALLAKLKKENLREQGTGNLGATNTMLIMGKRYGALVMLFDIIKAVVAVKLAESCFSGLKVAGMIAGLSAVVGHVFPFYLKFKGGKGLAAFGGLILAYNPGLFLAALSISVVLMLIVNYSYIMPFFGSVIFPVYVALDSHDLTMILLATAASVLVFVMHFENFLKARRGEDRKIRDFLKRK